MEPVLPAPATKHLSTLHHPLPGHSATLSLQQRATDSGTGTTGTTLWLGGQVLSAYLTSTLKPAPGSVALELGAGIGFLSITLAAAGYDVVSTDIEPVLSTVLAPNVRSAARVMPPGAGTVSVRELDWGAELPSDLGNVDVVVTADTVYAAELVPILWETLARVCGSTREADGGVPLYLALERRDPRMVDGALQAGRDAGFELRRVAHGRVAKAVERAYGWKSKEGWEGVEVWKGRWRGTPGGV